MRVEFYEGELDKMLHEARAPVPVLTLEELKKEHLVRFKADLAGVFDNLESTNGHGATILYRSIFIDPAPIFQELRARGYHVQLARRFPVKLTDPDFCASISKPQPEWPVPPSPLAVMESFCIVQ